MRQIGADENRKPHCGRSFTRRAWRSGGKRAAAAEVMKSAQMLWIAFKVMAAGAIPPEDAFRYAFENGADHVLAGDVQIARKILADLPKRTRAWQSPLAAI
ncbi:MAG: hypothetical protein HY298_19825 [Verrucomicrobia bacterium]|nr:hypothetical protein [Verrucomicrobiota bacterium]